jgi:hypothetical protein
MSILMSSLYTLILHDFTRIRNRKSKSPAAPTTTEDDGYLLKIYFELTKYTHVLVKLLSISAMAIMFVILFNTFSAHRNEHCSTLYATIFNYSTSSKATFVLKQAMLAFVCVYVFVYSHRHLTWSLENARETLSYLFMPPIGQLELNQSVVDISDKVNSVDDLEDALFLNSKSEIYRRTTFESDSTITTTTTTRPLLISNLTLLVYFLLCLLDILFLTKLELVYFWTSSFLILNLTIISVCLLINYFPYQVLVDSTGSVSFNLRSLFRATPVETNHQLVLKQSVINPECSDEASFLDDDDNDGSLIDSVFIEHKHTLKNKALSNKSLSFGLNQPCMRSAYAAVFGYLTFLTTSVLVIFLADRAQQQQSDWRKASLTLASLSFLLAVLFASAYFFLIKNVRETIYRQNLFYNAILFPYGQLILAFLNVCLILKMGAVLRLVLIKLAAILVALFAFNRVYLWISSKKRGFQVNGLENVGNGNANGMDISVFTIDPSRGDRHQLLQQQQSTTTVTTITTMTTMSQENSKQMHGSETSNINLMIIT